MDCVIIRCDSDLNKINENTNILEFIEYDGLFDVSNLELESVSFTKMNVDAYTIPSNIKVLSLFDSDFNGCELNRFVELEELEITNRIVDVINILNLKKLHTLNLNFSNILNADRLCELELLENISLVDAHFENFDFLFNLKNIKSVIVSEDDYFKNKEVFLELSKKGIFVLNMMGGAFNDL